MAGRIANTIVTNGLVLYLDAANRRSYPGTGTVWNDLTTNNNNGTLINGPTFSSDNGGSIVFDGVNDYASIPYNVALYSVNFTLSCWFYRTRTNVAESIISTEPVEDSLPYENYVGYTFRNRGIDGFWFSIGQRGYGTNAVYSTIDTNKWLYLTGTKSGTTLNFYVNGSLVDIKTAFTANINSTTDFYIGSIAGLSEFFSGGIGSVKYYNRALSAQEVLQNYNALKSRYV